MQNRKRQDSTAFRQVTCSLHGKTLTESFVSNLHVSESPPIWK